MISRYDNKQITDFFPFPDYRLNQKETLLQVQSLIQNGVKDIILEMPTGSGKSPVAISAGLWSDHSYCLTSQKILQDQYTRDFEDDFGVSVMKGRSNYECTFLGAPTMCNECYDPARKECYKQGLCLYQNAKKRAMGANVALMNYAYFLNVTECDPGESFKPRKLLICDECLPGDALIWIINNKSVKIEEIYRNKNITHVISFNEQKNIYEKKKILRRFRNEVTEKDIWYKITVEIDGKITTLKLTSNHKVWTKNRGYIVAEELTLNDVIKFDDFTLDQIKNKIHNVKILKIKKCKKINDAEKFRFNIEVEDNHNYFANSILVSNCHRVESELMGQIEFLLSEYMFKRVGYPVAVPTFEELPEYEKWIEEHVHNLASLLADKSDELKRLNNYRIKLLKSSLEFEKLSGEAQELTSQIEELDRLVRRMRVFLSTLNTVEWIFTIEKTQKLKYKRVVFRPLTVDLFANDALLNFGEHRLYMSATILDHKSFCRSLGINHKEAEFIRVPSNFPVKNRRMYFTNTGYMNMKNIDETLPKIVEDVVKALTYHKEEKGLIHCVADNSIVKIQENRIKLINELKPGIQIKSFNEITKQFEFKTVKKVYDNGIKECIKLKFLTGDIICTVDHLFLTKRGWVKAIDLNESDDIINDEKSREKLLSKEHVGLKCVYDLEIEDNHNYICNNLVVHNCHSYKIANYIEENCANSRLLFHTSENRENILQKFIQSKDPLILVSPSMTEGLDLKDDLARWEIIVKIPYLYIGDKQVARRMTVDPDWYNWQTCLTLVQSYGRIFRSETDWGTAYLFDSGARRFITKNKDILPKWFLEACMF